MRNGNKAQPAPSLVVLAGPNGAGKSTAAPELLKGELSVTEFVNADVIASGLSAFDPERAAFAAGRIMLARIHELAAKRVDFAFETTLASRSFAPWMKRLSEQGYELHLVFLWLPAEELAIARVRSRVQEGGHNVPAPIVRRRYERGLANFRALYMPLVDGWRVYDAAARYSPQLIASGGRGVPVEVFSNKLWMRFQSCT